MANAENEIGDERLKYGAAWRMSQIYEGLYWTTFVLFIPDVLILGWILSPVFGDKTARMVVFFANWIVTVFFGWKFANFKCPRCRKKFFTYFGAFNAFTRTCLHCGLKKYAVDGR